MKGTHQLGSWSTNYKGYPRIKGGPLRDWLLHRAVVADRFRHDEISIGVVPPELPKDWQVHHQAGKLHFAPEDLVALPACLHAGRGPLPCPYTGEFLTPSAWQRRFGSRLS
jgi:hypothetical protein